MRVPIYPDDLFAGTGFIRLARTLKRDWLGIEPISLSQASELMSRCLGYSNLHDLKRDAKLDSTGFVPLATAMAQCLATMTSELMESGQCRMLNIGELQEQIFQWPFLQLSTYRNHYGHTDNRMVSQAVKTELIDAYLDTLPTRPSSGNEAWSRSVRLEDGQRRASLDLQRSRGFSGTKPMLKTPN